MPTDSQTYLTLECFSSPATELIPQSLLLETLFQWARMWRNWRLAISALLVGMHNGAAIMEDSMAVPQKLKRRITT